MFASWLKSFSRSITCRNYRMRLGANDFYCRIHAHAYACNMLQASEVQLTRIHMYCSQTLITNKEPQHLGIMMASAPAPCRLEPPPYLHLRMPRVVVYGFGLFLMADLQWRLTVLPSRVPISVA